MSGVRRAGLWPALLVFSACARDPVAVAPDAAAPESGSDARGGSLATADGPTLAGDAGALAPDGAVSVDLAGAVSVDASSPPTLVCGPNRALPPLEAACTTTADCLAVIHQTDCCGSQIAVGIRTSERARFEMLEQACRASYPQCMCAPRQLTTEDGSLIADPRELAAECVAGRCTSFRAGCQHACPAGESCFACPEGPQNVYRCSRVCRNDADCAAYPGWRCTSLLGGPFCAPQSCGTP